MSEKESKQLPIGIGGKKLKENKEEMLPAIEVDNEVEWVNPEIEAPFGIVEGKPTSLGMFYTSNPEGQKLHHLKIMPGHKRTGILGRVIFKDAQGRLYRDVDLKGVGYNLEGVAVNPTVSPDKTWGIARSDYVANDKEMTEEFLRVGIRTYRIIAVTKLKEIVVNKKKISIEQAIKLGFIKEDDDPVVEIRAFGTRTRVGDIRDYSQYLLDDAIEMVKQELNKKPDDKFGREEYFDWFLDTMAKNLAIMHNNGWIHGYLTPHNVTLDARIVDLDSVETAEEITKERRGDEKSQANDFGESWSAISLLCGGLKSSKSSYLDVVYEEYRKKYRFYRKQK